MNSLKRTGLVAALAALAAAPQLAAQVPGMPLFTNPRIATGFRVHADYGMPTKKDPSGADLSVFQGGLGFVLGPVGIDANIGSLRSNLKGIQACQSNPSGSGCNANSKVTASALAQIKVMGGGRSNLSLSIFGGGSMDLTAYDALDCSSFTGLNLTICQAQRDQHAAKQLTIPVGAALGLRIPLGFGSLNLWGAPRMSITKFVNCPAGQTGPCDAKSQSNFRWALGADFPILRVLSIRAAYESGKEGPTGATVTTSNWGIGASLGIGGMR
ncbi:MAG TPA: hypothetical protein VGI92_11310 [Gemmatimonadales bacterium]